MENQVITHLIRGSFGSIDLCQKDNGEKFVSKTACTSSLNSDILREYLCLVQLDHPNIVKVFGYQLTHTNLASISLEYIENGDLFTMIEQQLITTTFVKSMIEDLMSCLKYLHSKNIVHSDIKPENMLICKDNHIKLCDFGMVSMDGKPATGYGTHYYAHPRIFKFMKSEIFHLASKSDDIWSTIISIIVVLTGELPWVFASETDKNYRKFCCNIRCYPFTKLNIELVELFNNLLFNVKKITEIDDLKLISLLLK